VEVLSAPHVEDPTRAIELRHGAVDVREQLGRVDVRLVSDTERALREVGEVHGLGLEEHEELESLVLAVGTLLDGRVRQVGDHRPRGVHAHAVGRPFS